MLVKSIDVALRATTTEFESGMSRSSAAMNSFEANAKRVEATMGKAVVAFNTGGISADEYSKTIQACEKELNAMAAGFSSMGAATSRAQSILLGMENETDKYNRKLKELTNLKQIGALKEHEYAKAVAHTTAEYQKAIPAAHTAGTATDKLGLQFASNIPVVGRFTGLMSGMGTPLGIASAALLGAGTAVKIFKDGFQSAAQVVEEGLERIEAAGNAAQSTGMLTANFQRLEFAFSRADISPDKMIAGIQRMNKAISEGLTGTTSAVKTFRELGVDLNKLSAMSPDKAFRTLAEAISNVKSPFDRTRLSMEIFGKSGGEFVRVLQDGARGLDEVGRLADKFRIPTSELDSSNVQEAQDALFDLGKSWQGLKDSFTRTTAPMIKPVADDLTNALTEPSSAIKRLTGSLSDITSELSRSHTAYDAVYRISNLYFTSSAEKAATTSEAMKKLAEPIKKVAESFTSEEIEHFTTAVEAASKRHQVLSKTTIDAQKALRAEFLETARAQMDSLKAVKSPSMDTIRPTLDMPRIPSLKPIEFSVLPKFDVLPKFEAKPIDLEVRPIIPRLSLPSIPPLRVDILPNLKPMAEAQTIQAAMQASTSAAMSEMVSKQNAIVAAQQQVVSLFQESAESVRFANQLFAQQRIGIEQRNSLLRDANVTMLEAQAAQQALSMGRPDLKSQFLLEISTRIDTSAMKMFESNYADLQKRLASGAINKTTFTHAFVAAEQELARIQELLKAVNERQVELSKTAAEADKNLHATRLATLHSFLSEQREAWSRSNPALAAYDALMGKVAQLDDLVKGSMLTMEERNKLVAFEAELTKSSAVAAQEALLKKINEVNEAYRAGLIPLMERNKLLSMPGEIGKSPVMDEASKKLSEMKSRSAAIMESIKTPADKFKETILELHKLERLGVESGGREGIDRTTAMLAGMEARQKLIDSMRNDPALKVDFEQKGPAALEAGTQEAFSAFHGNRRNFSNEQKLQDQMAKDISELLKEIRRHPIVLAKGKF